MKDAPSSRLGKYLSSERSALALILFWFGGCTLMASLVVGLQATAVPRPFRHVGEYIAIPVWGIAAVTLAILLRKREPGMLLRILGAIWLTSAFVLAAWAIDQG